MPSDPVRAAPPQTHAPLRGRESLIGVTEPQYRRGHLHARVEFEAGPPQLHRRGGQPLLLGLMEPFGLATGPRVLDEPDNADW
jgi:hypothetical protein